MRGPNRGSAESWENLFSKFLTGSQGALVRLESEGVLFFASQSEFTGENFGGFAHVQAANWIGEAQEKSDARLKV